ncbi:MAG: hypothetical protein ACKVK5_15215 [Pseudomonadales bacterium]|tara:strand:- start:2027 stop:4984 length:2958 start_codon:yes stop_codon:yes gene_type:complete
MSIESMFHEAFKMKQIVLINSGAYCYTKARIDQHTALLGDNNKGKTSMLNALKFFLLPEENLHDCERKFGFKSTKGHYGRDATFGFYFPERNSFMVLEAENPHGPFCIILNMGTKQYSYERTAVPVPYSEIEHLFWNHESSLNGGMGAPIEGLSTSQIEPTLKRLGAVVIKDVANIKERIYRHQPTRPDAGRFCLLPLKSGGSQSREIDAWKRLIHLAFDIAAKDKRTLPDTIATIIEGRKDRTEAELNVNLIEILSRYETLSAVKNRLQVIRNGQPYWDRFTQNFTDLHAQSSDLMNLLCDVEQGINQQGTAYFDARMQCFANYSAVKETADHQCEQAASKNTQRKELKGAIGEITKNYERIKKDSIDLSTAMHGYASMTPEEIAAALAEQVEEDLADIKALKDDGEFRREFEQLTREINKGSQKVKDLEVLIEGAKPSLLDLDQISSPTADTLYSLNQEIFTGECPPLLEGNIETIKRFAALFKEEEGSLTFLSSPTLVPVKHYDAGKLLQSRKDELASVQKRLIQQKRRASDLANKTKMSVEQIESTIAAKQAQIERDERNIALLKRHEFIEQEFVRLGREYREATEQFAILEARCLELNLQLDEANRLVEQARTALEAAKEREQSMLRWRSTVNDILHSRLEFLNTGYQRAERQDVVVTQELMDAIETRSQAISRSFNQIKLLVSDLLVAVALDDDAEHAHRSAISLETLTHLHEKYRVLYGRLDMEESNHFNQVVQHNDDTMIQVQSIRHARTLISTFIKEIENHLSSIKVSNLTAVAIECKLHPQFDELLKTVDSVNLTGGELPPQVLYDRLGKFCTEFVESDQRRDATLNMARLIVSVDYRVKLQGSDEFTVEAQSTGTSVMINCRLLAFLLKELLQADTKVSLPLFIDELSNLDDRNLRSARDIADADGFCVFGATPGLTSGISKVLGNYMNLDYFNATDQSYSPNRTILYTGVSESLIALECREAVEPALAAEIEA